jgi:hypothetical protein
MRDGAPDGVVAQHPLLDDPVDCVERSEASAEQRIAENGLHRSLGGDARLVLGIADRLGLSGTAEEPNPEKG